MNRALLRSLPYLLASWPALATASPGATLWTDTQARQTLSSNAVQRTLALNEATLQTYLDTNTPLDIPLPQGGFASVRLVPVELLAPDIAAEHPELRTWRVESLDGQILSGRAELTPLGFHAMLTLPDGDTLFVEPSAIHTQAEQRQYRSLSKRDNAGTNRHTFSCGAENTAGVDTGFAPPPAAPDRQVAERAGETLVTYDIAIAATGEYTQYYGGSTSATLASIVTTLNRVNEIYQRDLSIRLRLVSGTNTIYTNPLLDPYTGSTYSMLGQNHDVLASVIGNSRYDVGHAFSVGDGGIATLGGVCNDDYKGEGVSSWSAPGSDIFAIDYFAHELGHQLGATHSFSGTSGSCSGGRIGYTAYEPGSGSSIMGYAGICGRDNLQSNSDAMFNAGAISQITQYTQLGYGARCAAKSALNNSNPVVNAGPDYTLPASTPFILSGSATDADKDTLSYSWEEMDAGSSSTLDTDNSSNALVRVQLPVATPERTIPRLSDLQTLTHTYGETLPSTHRYMNFRLQVRDGKGGIAHDDTLLVVYNTGTPFAVTAPANTALVAGSALEVKWNVADTDKAPISCPHVDLALNTGSSSTFQTLLTGAPNNGLAMVNLPPNMTTPARIRVKCSNNIFFALSGTNPTASKQDAYANTTPVPIPSGNTGPSASTASDGGGGSTSPSLAALLALLVLARKKFNRKPI